MNNQSTETLAQNYITAVKSRKAAYRRLAGALNSTVVTAMRTVGNMLVETSDEVEEILSSESTMDQTVVMLEEGRSYLRTRQYKADTSPLTIGIETGAHLRNVLGGPGVHFSEATDKLIDLARRQAAKGIEVASVLVRTLDEYVNEAVDAEEVVEDALDDLNEAAK